jgi:hypothetical protein
MVGGGDKNALNVRHLLDGDGGLPNVSGMSERPEAEKLRDVAAEHRISQAVGAFEREAEALSSAMSPSSVRPSRVSTV